MASSNFPSLKFHLVFHNILEDCGTKHTRALWLAQVGRAKLRRYFITVNALEPKTCRDTPVVEQVEFITRLKEGRVYLRETRVTQYEGVKKKPVENLDFDWVMGWEWD